MNPGSEIFLRWASLLALGLGPNIAINAFMEKQDLIKSYSELRILLGVDGDFIVEGKQMYGKNMANSKIYLLAFVAPDGDRFFAIKDVAGYIFLDHICSEFYKNFFKIDMKNHNEQFLNYVKRMFSSVGYDKNYSDY